MPYADRQRAIQAMRAYAQTPQGKAAKARSHAAYVAKRRMQSQSRKPEWRAFVDALAHEIANRSHT